MRKQLLFITAILIIFSLNACTVLPDGPAVTVHPGTNKSSSQFDQDTLRCQSYALEQSGGKTPNQAKEDTVGRNLVVSTIFGAILGAAIGHGVEGIALGSAAGALLGGVIGEEKGNEVGEYTQSRYDQNYINCMYAAGHKVPVRVKYIEKTIIKEPIIIYPDPPSPTEKHYSVPPDYKAAR